MVGTAAPKGVTGVTTYNAANGLATRAYNASDVKHDPVDAQGQHVPLMPRVAAE